jgi:hypothetical protein
MKPYVSLVILSVLLVSTSRDGMAQTDQVPLEARIGLTGQSIEIVDVPVITLSPPKGQLIPFARTSDTFALRRDRAPAEKAAEIDPGIVIKPDPSIQPMIVRIIPPVDVDPDMIIPKQSPGLGGISPVE